MENLPVPFSSHRAIVLFAFHSPQLSASVLALFLALECCFFPVRFLLSGWAPVLLFSWVLLIQLSSSPLHSSWALQWHLCSVPQFHHSWRCYWFSQVVEGSFIITVNNIYARQILSRESVNISISTSHNFRQQCDCEISNAQNDGQ
jgi:hypothetical protein